MIQTSVSSVFGGNPAPQGSSSAAKRPVSNMVLPCMELKGIRDDGGAMGVLIPKSTEGLCSACRKQGPLKELSRHHCSEYSGSDAASLQCEKLMVTDPWTTYKDHQLTALAWILKPYKYQWKELAEVFGLSLDDREDIEAKYDDDLRVLAVMDIASERFKQYEGTPMNKGYLINALQKIQVETSILKEINTAKLTEERIHSRLVTMQVDCSDEHKIIISNPDKLVSDCELKGIKDILSIYNSKWNQLAMVFYFTPLAIKVWNSNSDLRNLYEVLNINCMYEPSCFNKRLVMTALQLIGMRRPDLEKINELL